MSRLHAIHSIDMSEEFSVELSSYIVAAQVNLGAAMGVLVTEEAGLDLLRELARCWRRIERVRLAATQFNGGAHANLLTYKRVAQLCPGEIADESIEHLFGSPYYPDYEATNNEPLVEPSVVARLRDAHKKRWSRSSTTPASSESSPTAT